jgi:uncharacterized cysteine cluster protein YcgN (CxxCxxCC family)
MTAPPAPARPWWETVPLAEMDAAQWEALCDGCGKCCLIRLEDEDTGTTHTTDAHCRLFDSASCRCSDYAARQQRVPDCVRLTPENVGALGWMPRTCAYRLLAEGKPLHQWHPLVSGDPESVHRAGMSVRGRTIPEGRLRPRQLVRRITVWPGEDQQG